MILWTFQNPVILKQEELVTFTGQFDEPLVHLVLTDSIILERIRSNNPKGLEELFNKYYSFITRTAFYVTGDKQVSEDLAQDIFVKIWERKESLPDIKNLKGYLTVMIRNSALDYLDQIASGNPQLEQYLYFEEQIAELSHQQTNDLKKQLSDALLTLPPRCRLIFSLNRLEGLTNQEIANYLDISKRTVETQISKALKLLRVELSNVWTQYFMGLFF